MGELGRAVNSKENVVMQCGNCSVSLLPKFGGKIASIRVNDHELLQAPLLPVAPRDATMTFDAGDASGWDECLPSVADCTVPVGNGTADIPDHGDLWRVEWKIREQVTATSTEKSVILVGSCFSLPLELERTLTLAQAAEGFRITARYKLTNTGDVTVPWSWAAHPLYIAEAGDRLLLPDSITTLRLEGSGGDRLGKKGDTVKWPIADLTHGTTDLSLAQDPKSGIGDKLFAGPLSADQNWCALERPSAGVRIRVEFDPAENPYLGLWICYGGWPDGPGPKQTCVALEPATAPVDSLAISGPWSRVLEPRQSSHWTTHVNLELLSSETYARP